MRHSESFTRCVVAKRFKRGLLVRRPLGFHLTPVFLRVFDHSFVLVWKRFLELRPCPVDALVPFAVVRHFGRQVVKSFLFIHDRKSERQTRWDSRRISTPGEQGHGTTRKTTQYGPVDASRKPPQGTQTQTVDQTSAAGQSVAVAGSPVALLSRTKALRHLTASKHGLHGCSYTDTETGTVTGTGTHTVTDTDTDTGTATVTDTDSGPHTGTDSHRHRHRHRHRTQPQTRATSADTDTHTGKATATDTKTDTPWRRAGFIIFWEK